jgi:hypothetical protein
MINDIISGVCARLTEEFGEDTVVYSETTDKKEGLLNMSKCLSGVTPYFFISCKNPLSGRVKDRYFTHRQLLGNRYMRSSGLCVEYRPKVGESASVKKQGGNEFPHNRARGVKNECGEVLDRLFQCLEYINVGDSILRGSGMQGEYVDDVLNFFVSYDAFVYYEEEKVMMSKLEEDFYNIGR